MFLVPVAVVGYSMWEKRKKQEEASRGQLSSLPGGGVSSINSAVVEDGNGDEVSSSSSATAVLELIGSSVTSDSMETLSLGGTSSAGASADAAHDNNLPTVDSTMMDTMNEADSLVPLVSLVVNEHDDEKEEKTSDLDDSEENVDPTAAEIEDFGPLQGLLRFVQDQRKRWQDEDERRRIKTNQEALTYEVLGHQGECTPTESQSSEDSSAIAHIFLCLFRDRCTALSQNFLQVATCPDQAIAVETCSMGCTLRGGAGFVIANRFRNVSGDIRVGLGA